MVIINLIFIQYSSDIHPISIIIVANTGSISMGNKMNSSSRAKNVFAKMLSPLPESYIEVDKESAVMQHPEQLSLRTYIIMLNGDEQDSCIKSLNFRKKHADLLIQILYGQLLQDQKQYKKIKVYVEYIVLNLQQFINIHFSDIMPIFYWAFKGFQVLFQEFGAFTPDPRMIGFNQKAQVKVWGHIKYSRSKPQATYHMYDEAKMVEDLIEIFSNKIDISSLPIDSHRRKFAFVAKSFDDAIKLIESQVQSADLIPKTIKCISQFLESGRKIHQNEIVSLNSEFYHKDLEKTIKFKYSDPDPNAPNKPKVNFSFGSQTSKKQTLASLPKVNFTATSPDKISKPISTNASTKNEDSKISITISPRHNPSKQQTIQMTVQAKNKNRSTSLIKFTYT